MSLAESALKPQGSALSQKRPSCWGWEDGSQLRACAALAEDQDLSPDNHMTAHDHFNFSSRSDAPFWLPQVLHACGAFTCRHIHRKFFKKYLLKLSFLPL